MTGAASRALPRARLLAVVGALILAVGLPSGVVLAWQGREERRLERLEEQRTAVRDLAGTLQREVERAVGAHGGDAVSGWAFCGAPTLELGFQGRQYAARVRWLTVSRRNTALFATLAEVAEAARLTVRKSSDPHGVEARGDDGTVVWLGRPLEPGSELLLVSVHGPCVELSRRGRDVVDGWRTDDGSL